MPKVVIYHNPRCSKSRQTLALLESQGVDPEIVLYLDQPPSVGKLDQLCKGLGVQPLELMRTKEKRFQELGLSRKDQRSRQAWLKLMHQNPVLIERPIVVNGGKMALGRPPENVLGIL